MRLVTWNCRVGGFRKKAKYLAALRPDVLAVQEVEPIDDTTTFAGDAQPTFRDRLADPAFPRRAIGMFSYTDIKLRPVDLMAPLFSFRRYEVFHGDLSFNLVAVWPWQTRSSKTAYPQAHEGLSLHTSWIRERPTVILGDFNASASFKGNNWNDLLDLLKTARISQRISPLLQYRTWSRATSDALPQGQGDTALSSGLLLHSRAVGSTSSVS